jgi:subtilisin family serine protease
VHPPATSRPALLFACAALASGCGPLGSSAPASEIAVGPQTVALRGTSTATIDITANGSWVAEAPAPWLSIDRLEGSGNERMTITVDRSGLEVSSYDTQILLYGDSETTVTVPISMRFPELSGSLSSSDGHLQARLARTSRELQPGKDYVPGEVIVALDRPVVALSQYGRLDADVSAASLQLASEGLAASIGARGAKLISVDLGASVIKLASDDIGQAIAALERDGRVRYAEPNYIYYTQATNDEYYEYQWHYQNINLEQTWEMTQGFEDVLVGVIDADFHPHHPDLTDNFLPGWNFIEDSDDVVINNQDCGSHGSHVAGTIAAVTGNDIGVAGIAPNARIIPLNVAARTGGCGLGNVAQAIAYAAGGEHPTAGRLERPVDVINMSLGGAFPNNLQREAAQFAIEQGVVVIAAAGNASAGLPDPETPPCDVMFPAAFPEVIAVGATDQFDARAPYSCTGPEVLLAAPGGHVGQPLGDTGFAAGVLSTIWNYGENRPGYSFLNGTSMASPHVAGVAALMRSVNPNLTHQQVADILVATAVDLGSPGHNIETGHGLIDAAAAVAAARDGLRVSSSEVVVRLYRGSELIAESSGGPGGTFELGALAAGEYRVEAGSLRNGQLGVPGTVYGELAVNVSYDGDVEIQLPVTAQ